MRRIRIAVVGAVLCLAAQLAIVYGMPIERRKPKKGEDESSMTASQSKPQSSSFATSILPRDRADAPDKVNEEFAGKPVKVLGGGAKVIAKDKATGEEVELMPTGTSSVSHFPKTIFIPSPDGQEEEYKLLGLGIRTVSFLNIQVYVVGLYVQKDSLGALQADLVRLVNPLASALIPDEKESLRGGLLDAERSYAIWDTLLREKGGGLKTVWRIVPVRNTDFQHLRDGWVRGITTKTQAAASRQEKEYDDETFALAMREFKALFGGKGRAPKGSVVLLKRDTNGRLAVLFQEKDGQRESTNFGVVDDERIARLIWLGYLGGKNVSSEGARKGVVDGIMELVERPIGSVETKVS